MRERNRVFFTALLFALSSCAAEGNSPLKQDHLAAVERDAKEGESPEFLTALAGQYIKQGKYDQAEPLLREALAARRRTLGDEHYITLASQKNPK